MTPAMAPLVVGAAAGSASASGDGLLVLGAAILVLVLCMIGFAATAAWLRLRNREKELAWQARERRWEEKLLDVLAGAATPAAIWMLVLPGEELYFVDYLLRYSRRLRGSMRHVLEELARPYLAGVVERLQAPDAERRARAVETLALLGFGAHLPLIVGALDDSSPLVSMIAVRAIALHKRPEHVALLLDEADRLGTWSPRQMVAVLVSMGPAAVTALRDTFADRSRSATLRATAGDALRLLHDPAAAATAAEVLQADPDREVLASALRLLGDLGRAEQLIAARPFVTHPDPVLRAAAMQALAASADAGDLELLREGVRDDSGWVAIQAVRSLKAAGETASLCSIATEDGDRAVLARQILLERA